MPFFLLKLNLAASALTTWSKFLCRSIKMEVSTEHICSKTLFSTHYKMLQAHKHIRLGLKKHTVLRIVLFTVICNKNHLQHIHEK